MTHRLFLPVLAAAAMVAGAAAAHHSYGMFDREKEQQLSAVVKEFQWTNPHSRMSVVAEDRTWDIELGPPGELSRAGWKRTSLRPGDKIQLVINPLRDGSPGGHLLMVTTASGQDLFDRFGRSSRAAAKAQAR